MLEYLFFDDGVRRRFLDFLQANGVEARSSDETGCIAEVPEELEERLATAIDDHYEQLLQEMAAQLEHGDDALELNVAGVTFQLADGTPSTVRLDPDLVARILNCITMEELRDMVQLIAARIENPDNSPLCHRLDTSP